MNSSGIERPSQGPSRAAGVSLIEVLIALVILTAAGTLLAFSSRSSVTGQLRTKVYGDAATATREAMENIDLLPFDSLVNLNNASITHSQGPSIHVFASVRSLLPTDVADINALDTSSLRYITLRTEFKSQAGSLVSKHFSTIIFRP
jgi:Tfp pilus assembly protein PilV